MQLETSDPARIAHAVSVLRAGGLVAFPTETVYGLGADAGNPEAVRKVYAVKGRPSGHPLIVHLHEAAQLELWAREIPPAAQVLAQRFWPGPLTLVLKRAAAVSDAVTGGQDSVAVRVPAHPLARTLLREFGGGVVAPSANRFGHVSATSAQHVRDEFGAAVDCILDGGACEVGIESAIVDVSCGAPAVLRPGWITAAEIEAALGMPLVAPDAQSPRASGTLEKHYAPRTPVILAEPGVIAALMASLLGQGRRVAVLARSARPVSQPSPPALLWHAAPVDAAGYAHELYANLRMLDAAGADMMIVEAPPLAAEWAAVRDRLARAAAGAAGPVERQD